MSRKVRNRHSFASVYSYFLIDIVANNKMCDPATGLALFAAKPLVSFLFKEELNRASKRNPQDSKWTAFFKKKLQTSAAQAKWIERAETLTASHDKFTNVIGVIEMQFNADGDGGAQQDTDASQHDRRQLVERAMQLLANKQIANLSSILFESTEAWTNDMLGQLQSAHDGFIECAHDTDHVHFYFRIYAVKMALLCQVYHCLMRDKSLKKLVVATYLAEMLTSVYKYLRDEHSEYRDEIEQFLIDLLSFTDVDASVLVRDAVAQLKNRLNLGIDQAADGKWSCDKATRIVVDWLATVRIAKPAFAIATKPMAVAASMIKQSYRDQFKNYDPFYFDLSFKFDMDSWIPITLRDDNASPPITPIEIDIEPFELIEANLARNGVVVITGDPGIGKTLLTQKIAFDYAKYNDCVWNKYDIVLLAEFRSTTDREQKQHETIMDLALYGLQKRTKNTNVYKFIKENIKECKRVLVILDGYDEAIDRQCLQLDRLFKANTSPGALGFDLIVTTRPTAVINRTDKISFLEIMGFETEKKRREYIEKHFSHHPNKATQIESVVLKIDQEYSYRQMAEKPLQLTFICLVHEHLTKGTRVELYETIVGWFIQRKLGAYPELLVELDFPNGNVASSTKIMPREETRTFVKNWFNLEQFRRLGYLSWLYLMHKRDQFDEIELQNLRPNITTSVFVKIGLILSDGSTTTTAINETKKYRLAHRTFQEYFAAMFIAKWADEWRSKGIEYEQLTSTLGYAPSKSQQQDVSSSDELWIIFVEILLAKREYNLGQTANRYLWLLNTIHFEIRSSSIAESWQQLNKINSILRKCPNVNEIVINLNKMFVDKSINLHVCSTQDSVKLTILNGIFDDNESNMLCVKSAHRLEIVIIKCQFSFSRFAAFASFVNANARQFQQIAVRIEADTITDGGNDEKAACDFLQRNVSVGYNGEYVGELVVSQSSNAFAFHIDFIIRSFGGINAIKLVNLTSAHADADHQMLLIDALHFPSNYANLSRIELQPRASSSKDRSIGAAYWRYINAMLVQKCPHLRDIHIRLSAHERIDCAIELRLLAKTAAAKVCIRIENGKFVDNLENLLCIGDAAVCVNVVFDGCEFTTARLMCFASHVDANSHKYKSIDFENVHDDCLLDYNDEYEKKSFQNIEFGPCKTTADNYHNFSILHRYHSEPLNSVRWDRDMQCTYVSRHFADANNAEEHIRSILIRIESDGTYRKIADVPALLRCICSIDALRIQGTRVELYELIVCWFIQQTLDRSPGFLAKLASNDAIFVRMSGVPLAETWFSFEQIRRLGYIALALSTEKKYIFDDDDIYACRPMVNINLFTEIGLIVSATEATVLKDDEMKKYQFVNRLMHDYFAAMFMARWEAEWARMGVNYTPLSQTRIQALMDGENYCKALARLFYLILLAKRDDKLTVSAQHYLCEARTIDFGIDTNAADSSIHLQLVYVNSILKHCKSINKLKLKLHEMSIVASIELNLLPTITDIELQIYGGIFESNANNMLSVSGASGITIAYFGCQFSLSRLFAFAQYVDRNAQKFCQIQFNVDNRSIVDPASAMLGNTCLRRFTGCLSFANRILVTTTNVQSLNSGCAALLSIVESFSGAQLLTLRLTLDDNNCDLLASIGRCTASFVNLTHLELGVCPPQRTDSIGVAYWRCVNELLRNAPALRTVAIGFGMRCVAAPIELQFAADMAHSIGVRVSRATFVDNRETLIRLLCDASTPRIDLVFDACRFSASRLYAFTDYLNVNQRHFGSIEFHHVDDAEQLERALSEINRRYDNIFICQTNIIDGNIVHIAVVNRALSSRK